MMEKFAFMKNTYSGLESFVKVVPYLDLKELVFWWYFFWPRVPLFWMFHSSSSSFLNHSSRASRIVFASSRVIESMFWGP